jgi:hypothetical protein
MQTTRLICALASAAVLCGSAPASVAAQTTAPATATTAPITTPTKAPVDVMTPAAAPTPGGAPLVPPGTLALDLRDVRARRTADGYVLTGEALVNDPCQAARFDSSLLKIYPPQFNLDQFRSPKKMGMLCIQVLAWVTAQPRTVTSAKPPAYVTLRSKNGMVRVPVR